MILKMERKLSFRLNGFLTAYIVDKNRDTDQKKWSDGKNIAGQDIKEVLNKKKA